MMIPDANATHSPVADAREILTLAGFSPQQERLAAYQKAKAEHIKAQRDAQYVTGPRIATIDAELRAIANKRTEVEDYQWLCRIQEAMTKDQARGGLYTCTGAELANYLKEIDRRLTTAGGNDLYHRQKWSDVYSQVQVFDREKRGIPNHTRGWLIQSIERLRNKYPELLQTGEPDATQIGKYQRQQRDAETLLTRAHDGLRVAMADGGLASEKDLLDLKARTLEAEANAARADAAARALRRQLDRVLAAARECDLLSTQIATIKNDIGTIEQERAAVAAQITEHASRDQRREDELRAELARMGDPKVSVEQAKARHREAAAAAGVPFDEYPGSP